MGMGSLASRGTVMTRMKIPSLCDMNDKCDFWGMDSKTCSQDSAFPRFHFVPEMLPF